MFRWLCVALALGGCDTLFGLETIDPIAATVQGTYRHRMVRNDSSFQPVPLEEILEVGSISIEAILDDGTRSSVDYRADGSFSFPVGYEGQGYRLIVDAPQSRVEFQHSAANIAIGTHAAGRRDALPLAATFVTFPFPDQGTATGAAHIASTGIYTFTNTQQFGPTIRFDWRLATPTSAAAATGLLDAAQHDRIYALEYQVLPEASTSFPLWTRLKAVSSASITQSTNMTNNVPFPQDVTPNTCAHVRFEATAELARLMSTHPRDYFQSLGEWFMFATPAPSHTSIAGSVFVAASTFAGARDIDVKPTFHNPFPGTTVVTEVGVTASDYLQVPGGQATRIDNATRLYVVPPVTDAQACNPDETVVEAHVGMIGKFELAGTELTFDNKPIELDRTVTPKLTWRVLAEGPVHTVTVTLMEAQVINGVTTLIMRWSGIVTGDSALIDPRLLEAGRTYTFMVTSSLGRREAAAGDFMTIGPPLENSTVWTRSFVVRDAE